MAVPIPEFWRLLMESRLLTHEHCQQLSGEFARAKSSGQADVKTLAKWLIRKNVISVYQAKVLLAGRPGPFFYGDYIIYDRVDGGRFDRAFRAVHATSRHPVLLQFITGDVTEDEDAWQEFVHYVRQECGFSHPYFQRCFELADLDAYKFLVLEDLHGETLADQLSGGKLPVREACRIVRQAALGLHDLHGSGRIHGDVRPENVFLEGGSHVKLVRDFASPPGPFPWGQPDPDGELLARTNYLAPEMSQTGRPPDPLTDIYALGCTLYEAVAGRPPFPGDDVLHKMHQHATARIQPLEEFGAPPQLGQIVAYMMAKNPQLRFQEAGSVAEQLAGFVNPAELGSSPPAPPPTLPDFEAHLRQKQENEQRRQTASRRVAPVGAAVGGGFPAVGAPSPSRSSAPSRASDVPDFSALADTSAQPGAPAVRPVRIERKKSKMTPQKWAVLLGSAAALLIAGFVALNFLGGDDEPLPDDQVAIKDDGGLPEETLDDEAIDSATGSGEDDQDDAAAKQPTGPTYQVVADDGKLPWASPTSGPPIDLSYAPPGAQMFFAFRPADLLASPHGAEAIKALGPRFGATLGEWESAAGVKLDEVEQLVVALTPESGEAPRASFVVRMQEPLDEAALASRWGGPPRQDQDGSAVYEARGRTFFVPNGEKGTFLMGAATDVEEVAKAPVAKPLLRREMERLLAVSDSQRHVSVLFAPNFLFFDGQKLFSGDLEKLREPLERFLGDGLNAGLASTHLGERFYVEMRLYGTLDRDKGELVSDMRDRLEQLPGQVEDYIARLTPHPYWRKLALRFPPMIRFLHQQTRIGTEGDHAIINAVLPGAAAPNLAAATELTLVSEPGAAYVAEAGPAKPQIASMDELLEYPLTLSFPQQSLDFAMRDVAQEVRDALPELPFPFDIEIIGQDLQMNGITQNQQIRDFEARNEPLRKILTGLVMKANPITTVTAPNEADQKLIWVVGPAPDDPSKNIILITTRDAAEKKGYTLPKEFQ